MLGEQLARTTAVKRCRSPRTSNNARIILARMTMSICTVEFEVITAGVMNVPIFWGIAPCSPYVNPRFEGIYHFHLQGEKQSSKKPACSVKLTVHLQLVPR
jgi:hypothetical protein